MNEKNVEEKKKLLNNSIVIYLIWKIHTAQQEFFFFNLKQTSDPLLITYENRKTNCTLSSIRIGSETKK